MANTGKYFKKSDAVLFFPRNKAISASYFTIDYDYCITSGTLYFYAYDISGNTVGSYSTSTTTMTYSSAGYYWFSGTATINLTGLPSSVRVYYSGYNPSDCSSRNSTIFKFYNSSGSSIGNITIGKGTYDISLSGSLSSSLLKINNFPSAYVPSHIGVDITSFQGTSSAPNAYLSVTFNDGSSTSLTTSSSTDKEISTGGKYPISYTLQLRYADCSSYSISAFFYIKINGTKINVSGTKTNSSSIQSTYSGTINYSNY